MNIPPKITIVNYGVGNLGSLTKAFSHCGIEVVVSEDAAEIDASDAIVLPGVGSFGAGMQGLQTRNLIVPLQKAALSNKPILGICLGAQLLLTEGHEFGIFTGLNIIPGQVIRLPNLAKKEKIPQIGWNKIMESQKGCWKGTIFEEIPIESEVYFVHSYILEPTQATDVLSTTTYGGYEFCSTVRRGNIFGCQFHPEKSGILGLQIIRNFVKLSYDYVRNRN